MVSSNQYETYRPWGREPVQPGQFQQPTQQPDIDQETAMEELRERYAHGSITIEEFQRVMGLLMVTTNPVELQAILDQLPPDPMARHAVSLARSSGDANAGSSSARHGRTISAFFGEIDRSHHLWELGPETTVNATFGEVNLDVRMARMSEGEHLLRLNATFGEITVIVPRGMRITVESAARFGQVNVPGYEVAGIVSREDFNIGADNGGGIALRIEATATFGEITIRTA